jgi:hypothetical protein
MSDDKLSVSEAAAVMGRKGGKAVGISKARTKQMRAWWASPAAARFRKKVNYADTNYRTENPIDKNQNPQDNRP